MTDDCPYRAFERYCNLQLGLSVHSLRAYSQDLKVYRRFAARLSDEDAGAPDLPLRFQVHMRDDLRSSPATIRRRMLTLRSFCKWRERERNGPPSPFDTLHIELKVPRRLPRPIDRPTLGDVLDVTRRSPLPDMIQPVLSRQDTTPTCPGWTTSLMIRLLIVTGLRVGELTRLKIGSVSGGATRIRVHGKGNRERTVYVANPSLIADFRAYLNARGTGDSAEADLFLNARGGRLTEAAFRKRLRQLSRQLAITPHLTPHRFRHSAATLLIEEGIDIRIVQRLLGHASIATTELYTKVSDTSLMSAIERADTLTQVEKR
jgi:integrase/recombinase XerD